METTLPPTMASSTTNLVLKLRYLAGPPPARSLWPVCASLDFWPASKCDYGTCPWANASALEIDLGDPLLVAAVRALSPLALRVGGSLADQLVYADVPRGSRAARHARRKDCAPLEVDATRRVGFRGGCLRWARWLELLRWCSTHGCGVFFTGNALHGRARERCPSGRRCRPPLAGGRKPDACCSKWSGAWDGSSLRALLQATAAAGERPAAVAFGNELIGHHGIAAKLAVGDYVTGLRQLHAMLVDAWPSQPPLVLAPDSKLDPPWFAEMLDALYNDSAAPPLPPRALMVTHHMYPLGAAKLDGLQRKALSARLFDRNAGWLRTAAALVITRSRGAADVGVSETGGCYNSGKRGLSDAFGSTLWWSDLLGAAARSMHSLVCRQALVGGHYGLLDLRRRQPSPDFYVLLLYRRLLARAPLPAPAIDGGGNETRAYAHCGGDEGGLVLMLINPALAADVNASVRGLRLHGGALSDRRLDYVLTAAPSANGDRLKSRSVALNGVRLVAAPDGALPPLRGARGRGAVVRQPALSLGLYWWPAARCGAAGLWAPKGNAASALEI